jgi:hypothetical protein
MMTTKGVAYITFSTTIENYAKITLNDTLLFMRIVGDAQYEDDN